MVPGYGGVTEDNVGGQGPPPTEPEEKTREGEGKSELGNPPSDLEIANWPRDEDVADDERDQGPKLELPKIGASSAELEQCAAAIGTQAIGVPVDATE
jgi:hypothetical protein